MNEFIDHTCLRPNATEYDIEQLCKETKEHKFRSVCVAPTYVIYARQFDPVSIVTVVGFPTGAHFGMVKIKEAEDAVYWGADEIDVVWNLGAFKSGHSMSILLDLARIVKVVAPVKVKVIIEEYYLDYAEKETAWKIVRDSGAWAIKTSTGFAPGGATIGTVKQWSQLGDDLKIKAAGGIKTASQARTFLAAGACIIGTSHGVEIGK